MLKTILIAFISIIVGGGTVTSAATDGDAAPDPQAAPSPRWIWGPDEAKNGEDRYFRVTFDAGIPKTQKIDDRRSAMLWAACDDEMTIYLNGKIAVRSGAWQQASLAEVEALLKPGKNVLAVKCHNDTGPGALAVKLEVKDHVQGTTFHLVTDETWKSYTASPKGWLRPNFDDAAFIASRVVGEYGMQPWGNLPLATPSQATTVDNIALPPRFKAELIYSVPKSAQGSWVSMTPEPKGRLYVSDQAGSLYRVTPGAGETPTTVEAVDLPIGQAQGLLWAFDSLYVVVNGGKEPNTSGLYRLRDTDNDDKLDQITALKHFSNRTQTGPAGSEHGPHAVVLGPDNMLYIVAGNFTDLPAGLAPTSPAQNWAEDLLLKRMTDGKGHDPTIYAPAGWVCRTDKDGKTWEAVAVGMRNAYDIAFSPDGELFTFDSDMEWDIGMPWWRPIRICHVVSGAEFGWRNGSAKWPAYYPDSVPPVLGLGVGSPTGVTFGTGAKFPEKYQRAFFASDWAYGKIYAVHLKPKGAGYEAEAEPFLIGKPFDVTDVVVNHDGAMYVTIGGRGTQSGLYRISYTGGEATDPAAQAVADIESKNARELRRLLEAFHGRRDATAVDFAWPHLSSDDRFIRYAARVAIESQDPAQWTDRALASKEPTEAINAIVALCRVENSSLQPRVIDALNKIDPTRLSQEQLLELLRAYQLCFIRMGRPMESTMSGVATRLDALFPHAVADVNHEICQLLVFLKAPVVIGKSLALLDQAETQPEKLFYIFTLRTVRDGWRPEQRAAYFKALADAQQTFSGGASFQLFMENMRKDAVDTLGDNEKLALGELLNTPLALGFKDDVSNLPPRQFVRNWAMEDLRPKLDQVNAGRSFTSGKAAFAALSCIKCHRFNGDGGASGPDISGVGNRFQLVDLLEAIVLPSKIISDQYQATEIITKRKQVHVGTIHEENDDQVVLRSSPLSTQTETVKKAQIAERRPSKTSIMPQGLIDVLNEDEVLDLLAYLRSGGDPKDSAFRKTTATPAPASESSANSD